jgi:hypothetical protein
MTSLDDRALLQLAHDLLGHLCEELSLNCTRGRIAEEAPDAAATARRAAQLLSRFDHPLPSSAFALFESDPARMRH